MLGFILGVLMVLGAFWIVAMATGWGLPYMLLLQGLHWLKWNPWESLAAAAFLLLGGLLLLLRPQDNSNRTFRTPSSGGEVRISQEALEEIIARSAKALTGIMEVQSKFREREAGLQITVACQYEQGVLIPQLSKELKEKVKEDVELYTGISVTEVKVLVRSLEKARTARVR
ncbi:alkaline shock response membrane anchor protein AmaP [Desulfosporosinus sp. FKB]|uniref:alkaline shock response membrane anchor protein AmaP n=1 Tax=Desulfosporosinus sp. FKB TaxID=1969835 RepID=UPI000B497EC4|nr:alkaline shock response membrane anchor protein AmaP [Desulfosporosinus sp. FKB]